MKSVKFQVDAPNREVWQKVRNEVQLQANRQIWNQVWHQVWHQVGRQVLSKLRINP